MMIPRLSNPTRAMLRPGADLSRIVLPTFILEPRSMLERITNFMCHPEMLLHIPSIDDPTERFVAVVKFYLSGWHIRPPGVKKPLNPILGEVFSCYWDLEQGKSRAYYISEQTSHHPPKSSYFYMVPDHHIRIDGTLKPRSRFLGNSAASLMEGIAYLSLLNRGKDKTKGEQYVITQPNMYARGIMFGKMKYELGDHSFVRCPELDLTADLEFKVKGWVGGTYNAIGGAIKRESTGEVLYELSGLWSDEMFIRDVTTGKREMFFNATKSKPSPPKVRPIREQADRESQRLWEKTANAVRERKHEVATDEKTTIEDRQREEAAKRSREGIQWHPRLFRAVKGGPGQPEEGMSDLEWIIDATVDHTATPDQQAGQIKGIYPIVDGQQATLDFLDGNPSSSTMVEPKPPSEEGPGTDSSKDAPNEELVETGHGDAAPTTAEPASLPAQTPDEIEKMLSSTGMGKTLPHAIGDYAVCLFIEAMNP
ncbi:Oxysterol-binding protein-like protein OBPalpha-like protein [Emericellopsis cladophorae]|uniref:Oxysterol-binding protein-like protein OBPalpha-like protein n=1 Tax=Emericellopsis cladophorae TaxID=2686198 RepID=A0A9P9XYC5_9HYPO|nr:Oxysterol-binding protein-like protein OBPalpha-like protein [Emericellopsis cladophorae]KAI6779594.1 Oxysterol-binding protein-like protein OBPalpha-like protein [Emericellopsis cladophorae]